MSQIKWKWETKYAREYLQLAKILNQASDDNFEVFEVFFDPEARDYEVVLRKAL
jgi:hypothetical protein